MGLSGESAQRCCCMLHAACCILLLLLLLLLLSVVAAALLSESNQDASLVNLARRVYLDTSPSRKTV